VRSALAGLRLLLGIALFVGALAVWAEGQSIPQTASVYPGWDTRADTWVATDALGRTLPGFAEAGPPRRNRTVGIFYFLWHGAHVSGGPYDITKVLAADPDAMHKPDSPLWGPLGANHHWGESLFGYYLSDDDYVLRKHAQMLSDAGVDVVIFDVTNQFTYRSSYMALLKSWSEVRAAGGRTPQVAFLTPFWDPERVVRSLYADLYGPGHYRDLWFRWDGKPLILADPALVGAGEGTREQNSPAPLLPGHTLGQSFHASRPFHSVSGRFPTWATKGAGMTLTLRRDGPAGRRLASRRVRDVADNDWVSLAVKWQLPPGSYYLEASEPRGKIGWWSNTSDVYSGGQAYADGAAAVGDRTIQTEPAPGNGDLRSFFSFRKPQADYFQGPTGRDQWSWLEVSPQHVYRNVRGEKEQMSVGVAQNAVGNRLGSMSEPGARGRSFHNGAADASPGAVRHGYNFAEQFDRALKEDPKFLFVTGWNEWFAARYNEFLGVKLPVMFVDTFDEEHSRDIEPMKGGHGDDYYYQLAAYVRRYKGVRKPPSAGAPKTIAIDGDFRPWDSVRPEYRDDIGDVARRDHPAWDNVTRYVNTSGRNDFVLLKVARDADNLYFYARTKDPISPCTDGHWMMLFLKTGTAVNWEGYDFVVNRTPPGPRTATLERSRGGWSWEQAAEVRYRVAGNELMLAIPRAALGLAEPRKPLTIDFKWADNIQKEGEIDEFTVNGDAAPNGRFAYRYSVPK